MLPGTATFTCIFDSGTECGESGGCADGLLQPRGQCLQGECRPSASGPQPCPGGLTCADEVSCKSECTGRLDCTAPFASCSSPSTCGPDGVSIAASNRGVTPASWSEPEAFSLEEIAQLLEAAGLPKDDQGIYLPGFEFAGLRPTLDPTLKTPMVGLKYCMYRINMCAMETRKIDECIAAMPRCVTSTPWDGNDPAGVDCCPEECLLAYFDELDRGGGRVEGLDAIVNSGCYPGITEYVNGGAQ